MIIILIKKTIKGYNIMANTRIRYDKNGISRRTFDVTIDGESVSTKVILDTVNLGYKIVDASDVERILLSGGNTKNLSVLKIQAKDGLKSLGYEFETETRNRGESSESSTSEDLSSLSVNA